MIQVQLKLKLTRQQERRLGRWLWHLTGVWNWAIRKIELDGLDGRYHLRGTFRNSLAGHSGRLGIPSHTLQGVLDDAHVAWSRRYAGVAGKPRLKGRRNRFNSISFPDPIRPPSKRRIVLPSIGALRFHKQELPSGQIKRGRIVHRASGWYLCCVIAAEPQPIERVGSSHVGIDPGFSALLALSTGEKVNHPHELKAGAERLAQAQRGQRTKLVARLMERQRQRRKDRNHKLSRRLVSENTVIAWSKDNVIGLAKIFGKSVMSASHAELRKMLAYKSRLGGAQFIEVASRKSTRTCSTCGALSGPTGWAGLKVRQWVCSACGAEHDRDTNAAKNTLTVGLGTSLKNAGDGTSGIAA